MFKKHHKIHKKSVDKGRNGWYSNKALREKQETIEKLEKSFKKLLTTAARCVIFNKLSAEPEATNCTLKIR